MDHIIDAHSHIGDILYPGGGRIIEQKGVRKKLIFDPITISQMGLNRDFGMGNLPYRIFLHWIIRAEQERNFTATRENARNSMDQAGVTATVCLPLPPYVVFSDVKAAAEKDPGLIPFTGVDFSDTSQLDGQFEADVAAGAKGLKLHPIIQKVSFTDPRMKKAVRSFMRFDLPILFHAGVSNYYVGSEKGQNIPEYGGIKEAAELVAAFPEAKFIVGHAGMFEVKDVMKLLRGYQNVWVDTSLQSPGTIRNLIEAFGEDKVLFASDWPFGCRKPAIKAVKAACKGNQRLERKLFYENACHLLKIEP
ncbi:MAG: amidohydrolase family protein [Thermodesulfobacteriota bacterium]